jgi:hypothetical protein
MDPNDRLRLAREASKSLSRLLAPEEHPDIDPDQEIVYRAKDLLEHFRALDDWMSMCGFWPADEADSDEVQDGS